MRNYLLVEKALIVLFRISGKVPTDFLLPRRHVWTDDRRSGDRGEGRAGLRRPYGVRGRTIHINQLGDRKLAEP